MKRHYSYAMTGLLWATLIVGCQNEDDDRQSGDVPNHDEPSEAVCTTQGRYDFQPKAIHAALFNEWQTMVKASLCSEGMFVAPKALVITPQEDCPGFEFRYQPALGEVQVRNDGTGVMSCPVTIAAQDQPDSQTVQVRYESSSVNEHDAVIIDLVAQKNTYSIQVQPNAASSYARIIDPIHSHHDRLLAMKRVADDAGVLVDFSLTATDLTMQLNPREQARKKVNHENAKYGFFTRWQEFYPEYQKMLQDIPADAYTYTYNLSYRGVRLRLKSAADDDPLAAYFIGRFLYCNLGIQKELDIPNLVKVLIGNRCSSETFASFVQNNLADIEISLTEKPLEEMKLDDGNQYLSFHQFATNLCLPTAQELNEASKADYLTAGWISSQQSYDNIWDFHRDCRFYVINTVLPKIAENLLDFGLHHDFTQNPVAQAMYEGVIGPDSDSEEALRQQMETRMKNIVALLDPGLEVYRWFDADRDLQASLVGRRLSGQQFQREQFPALIRELILPADGEVGTRFQMAFAKLDSDEQRRVSENLADLLTLQCDDSINDYCVVESRQSIEPFNLRFRLNGELYKQSVILGGLAF